MATTSGKKDYVSHHLPRKTLKTFSDDHKAESFAVPKVYTTSPNPVCSRGMTSSRKIGAAFIIAGHIVSLFCFVDMYLNMNLMTALAWVGGALFVHMLTGVPGITAGAHRLWAHRSYKAKLPARLFLAFFNTMANQSSILHWAVEHRVHHRHVDTDADPHNINRGFFFCHMGWLFAPRTDAFIAARKEIDDSDLLADPVVYYQDKYYAYIAPFLCYILPGILSHLVMGDFLRGFMYLGAFRWTLNLHITWCVNSVAHTFGTRPYRPDEKATEFAPVSFFSGGTYFLLLFSSNLV